jgi:hypothetical protein
MPYLLTLLGGFAAGVVMNSLFEKRAVEEVQKLRAYLAGELEKLAAKL